MTDNNDNNLNSNAFSLLMTAAQDIDNFDSHKFSYAQGPELSDQQKRKHADKKHKLAVLAKESLSFTVGIFFTKSLNMQKTPIMPDLSGLSSFSIEQPNTYSLDSNLVQYTNPISELHQKRLDAI